MPTPIWTHLYPPNPGVHLEQLDELDAGPKRSVTIVFNTADGPLRSTMMPSSASFLQISAEIMSTLTFVRFGRERHIGGLDLVGNSGAPQRLDKVLYVLPLGLDHHEILQRIYGKLKELGAKFVDRRAYGTWQMTAAYVR